MVSELIELSSVIGDIYDAAIDPALWQQALANMCRYVGGFSATLFWHDAATERSEVLHIFNETPAYTKLYFEKYVSLNPMFPAAAFFDAGLVSTVANTMPYGEFAKTRFFKEWCEPQGIVDAIAVNLEKGTTRASLIAVRTNVAVDEGMRVRMISLVPHLQRAVSIGRLFDQHQAVEHALTETLDHIEAAVFLVGADGAISFANDPARQMLDEATLVRKDGDVLHAIAPEADRTLHEIFLSAKRGDSSVGVRGVAVPLPGATPQPWFAHVLPLTSGRRQQTGHDLTAVAAVFIRKTASNARSLLEAIAKQYNLSPSEIRVLDAVATVQGVRQLAERLGVSQATVKTHLHNLFRKTGTNRQSELMKLAAGL